MDPTQLITQIGQLESSLAQWEAHRRDVEQNLHSATRNRTAGAAAMLLGFILGVIWLFLPNGNGTWLCLAQGALLGVIGLATLATAIINHSSAGSDLSETDQTLAQIRASLATARTQLIVAAQPAATGRPITQPR